MIPRLFPSDYADTHNSFTGHGLGELVGATEIVVKEDTESGHEWELSFTYPETGEFLAQLVNNAIVVAKPNPYQNVQAFRIYSVTKGLDHTVKVACQHISYDLSGILVDPYKKIGNDVSVFKVYNASDALAKISQNKSFSLPLDHFTYSTNLPSPPYDPSTDENTLEITEPKSIRAILFDGNDSVYGKYGGDAVIDNYSVNFLVTGGVDRGETIEYGKDLTSLSQELNIGEMITGIYPYCKKTSQNSVSIQFENNRFVKQANEPIITAKEAYTLEAGKRYKLSFYTDSTGQIAYLNPACGFGSGSFIMDGYRKDFEIVINATATYPADTVLIYSGSTPLNNQPFGEIYSISVSSEPIEPLIYGSITYGPGTYPVQKILPVDLTKFFSEDPTVNELNAKAQEWVDKEEIGVPDVDLTLSYANIDQNVHLYDAVRVKFVRMGIDVKAKVTSYEYDVLQERITSITVGRTKDSLYFTLEDASRLKRGILSPDRIGKKSITTDKYARGSVNGEAIAPASIGSYNIEPYSVNEELLSDKAVSIGKLKSKGVDPVLQSVPDNVYGGYHRNVGYLFDPSLGVPPDGMFGWTETDAQGKPTGRFHALIETKMDREYDMNSGGSVVKGMGYVLSPDLIFPESINANQKLVNQSVTKNKVADSAIDSSKIENGAIASAIYSHNEERKLKAWLDLYDGVGAEGVPIADDQYVNIKYLASTVQFEVKGGDIAFPGGSGGSLHFSPHDLMFKESNSTLVPPYSVGKVLSTTDMTIDVSALSSGISSNDAAISNLRQSLYGYYLLPSGYHKGDIELLNDAITDIWNYLNTEPWNT